MSVEAVTPTQVRITLPREKVFSPTAASPLTVNTSPTDMLSSPSADGGQLTGGGALLAAAESHLAATARKAAAAAAEAAAVAAAITGADVPGQQQQQLHPEQQLQSLTTTKHNSSNNNNNKSNKNNNSNHNDSASNNQQQSTAATATTDSTTTLPVNGHEMFQAFQNWASQNYGDSGKTKTVTRRKYDRIIRILSGSEQATTENSKFRFWVKAKGFRLGPSPPEDAGGEDQVLYVPTRVPHTVNGDEEKSYKRVAMVEDFFRIIYNVHVEMDGRGGKHAGQKRTYRAIAETYAFLPREAVTRFLMSCADCQKRMHLSLETNNNQPHDTPSTASSCSSSSANPASALPTSSSAHHPPGSSQEPTIIDFSVPITTTYLNHLRSQRGPSSPSCSSPPPLPPPLAPPPSCTTDTATTTSPNNYAATEALYSNIAPPDREDSMSSADSEASGEHSPSPPADSSGTTRSTDVKAEANNSTSRTSTPNSLRNNMPVKIKAEVDVSERNGTSVDEKPVKMVTVPKTEERGRKRRASDESVDSSTRASEIGLGEDGTKDEDDEDDGEDEEKLASSDIDPERLKAFNMFVRLFVDENLDRMVPISKQPKDKIQAILDACDRQFPEFHERSRKRIRTYLKSCRRMRRSKEQNGWESLRPTPPHLTSAAAEGLLAQACENESNNAKRMRMGLEPLPACVNNVNDPPIPPIQNSQSSPGQPSPGQAPAAPCNNNSNSNNNASSRSATSTPTAPGVAPPPGAQTTPALERPTSGGTAAISGNDVVRHSPVSASFRPSHELPSPFFSTSNGIFRPGGIPASYGSPPAHHHPNVIQHNPHVAAGNAVQNGESCPTDLSMKNKSTTSGSNSKNQLNPTEVATIKQLIAGYRESAAFLYRSADELEQLLLQQN